MAKNHVLYAVEDGVKKPLLSVAPDDSVGAAKINARIASAMHDAERRGVPCPEFKVVSEHRLADENGKILESSFQELDALTLKSKGKAHADLSKVFEKPAADAASTGV